nr:glycoside hydrolase family 5 protein [uncultured Prevotella sp.]
MKMKLFFRISVLVLCILMSLSSFADDKKDRISVEEIDWSASNQSLKTIASTPDKPNKIYLYAQGHNKFVTVGGRYGAQPILAEVGMYFYVEKVADNDPRYYIHSWVHNPTTSHKNGLGDYLGVEPIMDKDQHIDFFDSKGEHQKSIYLFVDRGKLNTHDDGTHSSPDRIKWYIKPVDGYTNGYQIYSTWTDNQGGFTDGVKRDYYLSYYEGNPEEKPQKKFLVVTTDVSKAETFYFIKKEDYRKVINNQKKKYINVSGLVRDARFERNNKGIDGGLLGDYNADSKNVWQFRYDRSDDAYVFPSLQDNVEELAYMTAWVGPTGSKKQNSNYLIQKITKLKPGLYRVNCQGFYFNPYSPDDKDNTSFVFASQNINDISNQTALKTIESKDWYSMQNMTYREPYPTAQQWNKDVVGWNLGNQFECSAPNQDGESMQIGNPDGSIHAETAWGNPVVTKKMIQAVKKAGFNAIRIPIRWQCHITNAQAMSIDKAWIARIKEVVGWCLDNDLKVIINVHHEKWLESRPTSQYKEENCNKLKLLWTNIASEFANYDSRLAFAGTNEVHIKDNWGEPNADNLDVQNAYNQTFVDAVRTTGGNNAKRHLIVQTYVCNPWFGINNGNFKIPQDVPGNGNNYMSVEFHYYQPWSYAGYPDTGDRYDYWGDAYKDAGKTPADNEKTMTDFFDRVVNTWSSQGLGIVIGEWGVTNRYNSNLEKVHENMNYYCHFLTTEAQKRGFSTFVWDNNKFDNGPENYGIFDRSENKNMEVKAPWILNGIYKPDGLNGYKDYSIKHCVNAGKIFAESNPYEDKDVDSRKYDNSVAVLVKADEGSETGTLYIGAGKRANEGGYAFFDNFQLFYMGDKQWYLDATNTNTDEFTIKDTDGYNTPSGINRNPKGDNYYEYPVTYNIRRYFHVNKWESLILPCTLTGDQVKQTFGGDKEVKLSVFDKVEGTCVKFRPVNPDTEGIVAGKPYIIKVGKKADIETKENEYTFPWGNNIKVKVKGPIYQVKGVVPPTFTGDGVTTVEKISGGYKVQFHGFYYDPGAAPTNAYVVNNGDMYHLSSAWNSFVGTSWYITITDAQGNAKALSFSFDGDSSTTAIENVTRQEDAAVQTDGFVYNLSGQRVGTRNNMSNLSSGIYIVAGKKVVVK